MKKGSAPHTKRMVFRNVPGTVTAVFLAAALLLIPTLLLSAPPAQGEPALRSAEAGERRGKLADGTDYLVRRPATWNGVVILDLDLLPVRHDRPFHQHLYAEGYGLAGTARRSSFPLEHNLRRVQEALAIFRDTLGMPERVIVYGRSRGGFTAKMAAELLPDEVDAAVSIAGTTPLLTFCQAFDFFFVLKALLAPEDTGLAPYGLGGTKAERENIDEILYRWRPLLDAAQATPGGRARIALAFAIAQYAGFGGRDVNSIGVSEPDIHDLQAVSDAMFEVIQTVMLRIKLKGANRSHEPIGHYIGNEFIDYAWYLPNITPDYKNVIEALYTHAALDIAADIERINQEPRLAPHPQAVRAMFDHEGRTHRGTPRIPLFRMDNIADIAIPTAQTQVYTDHVRRHGRDDLYRKSVVGRGGHAFCTLAEKVAAIRVVEYRLDNGVWPDTDAGSLNALAASLNLGPSKFVDYEHPRFNGQWRLHAYSRKFDITFANILDRINRFEAQDRIVKSAAEPLSEILLQAEQQYEQQRWEAAKERLVRFEANAAEMRGDGTARNDLIWDSRMMRLQIERDERDKKF